MNAFPREADVAKVRHIGIENELYVGAEHDNYIPYTHEQALRKHNIFQESHYDCGAREIVTNPISIKSLYQKRGEACIREYYDNIKKFARVSRANGTHIHISVLDGDHANLELNAMALSIAFYKQFQKIAGRKSNSWAQRPSCANIVALKGYLGRNRCYSDYLPGRAYDRGYNILTVTRHQTLEFRGPKGTTNVDEVLAWVEFLENIIKVSNCKSVNGVQFSDLVKGKRIEAYINKLPRTRTITRADLEQTLNEEQLR